MIVIETFWENLDFSHQGFYRFCDRNAVGGTFHLGFSSGIRKVFCLSLTLVRTNRFTSKLNDSKDDDETRRKLDNFYRTITKQCMYVCNACIYLMQCIYMCSYKLSENERDNTS